MWLAATALAWAGCEPADNADVSRAVDEAMVSYGAFEVDGFRASTDAAVEAASCLREVVSPEVAAGLHRVRGLRSFLDKDFGDAEYHFAAARLADPAYAWPVDIAPEDGPLLRRYVALAVEGGDAVPEPARGSLLIDGLSQPARPAGVPGLLQSISPAGDPLTTRLLDARDDLSIDGLVFQRRRSRPFWVAAAACGLAAAGTYGVALGQHAAFQRAADTGDADRIRSAASASRGLTITSGVLAAGGGALVGVGFALK